MMPALSHPIAILITSHNRREKTLECLRRLFSQIDPPPFRVYLVDDASSDRTADAVRDLYPEVQVIAGDGSLFWAGGMRRAWDEAFRHDHAAYVWLNDDVRLDRDALARLWNAHVNGSGETILGGSMRESEEGAISYSGSRLAGAHPFRFVQIPPDPVRESPVDVLHGNFVLVPREVAERVGGFAAYLVHHGGDYEYCRRAARSGVGSRLLPGTFGVCPDDHPATQAIRGLAGLRKAASAKHIPFRMGIALYREVGGPLWWAWLGSYYAKAMIVGF